MMGLMFKDKSSYVRKNRISIKEVAVKRSIGAFVRRAFPAFTLAELIVVVTVLAILTAIGFVALSGYAQDAKDSRAKTNVRSVYSAIVSESALSGNSPRYYVVHDPGYSLSGAMVAFVE